MRIELHERPLDGGVLRVALDAARLALAGERRRGVAQRVPAPELVVRPPVGSFESFTSASIATTAVWKRPVVFGAVPVADARISRTNTVPSFHVPVCMKCLYDDGLVSSC